MAPPPPPPSSSPAGTAPHNIKQPTLPSPSTYTPPTTFPLTHLPPSWLPYAELMRLDRPAGFYAFYVPYLIGLGYGACIAPDAARPSPAALLRLVLLLVPFNVVLRGAACAWNDAVDADFDRRVARTRHRPVARGAVSVRGAVGFALVLVAVLLAVPFGMGEVGGLGGQGVWWALPRQCLPHAVVAVVLLFAYALMKRVTYYPQVVLGIPFAWAVFFCVAALGLSPVDARIGKPTLALFGAVVLWTITYDTVYAHQDVQDDVKAGVKGMAVRFRDSTKLLAAVLSAAQVGLLLLCGVWAGFGVLYQLGTVGGVAAAMAYFIYDVDLKRPESCGAWFHRQFFLVGSAFVAGFVGEYVTRLL